MRVITRAYINGGADLARRLAMMALEPWNLKKMLLKVQQQDDMHSHIANQIRTNMRLLPTILFLYSFLLALSLSAYLDIIGRPEEVKKRINDYFTLVSESKKAWMKDGASSYVFFSTDSWEFVDALIKANPDQKDFFLLDVGAGNFKWGEGIANYLGKAKNIKDDVMVHVLNVTGENYGNINIIKKPKCTLYNISSFKIENLEEELQRILPIINLDKNSLRFDLVVSQWTFLHLVDPVGTFIQVYNRLRPKNGFALMHGFPAFFEESALQHLEPRIHINDSVVPLFAITNAPFLIQATQGFYPDFLLKRPDDRPLQLALSYGDLIKEPSYLGTREHVEKVKYVVGQNIGTWNSRTNFHPLISSQKDVQGDVDLYKWAYSRIPQWQESPMAWSPLYLNDSHKPITPEMDPLFKAAVLDQDLEKTKTIIDLGQGDVNSKDAYGGSLICRVFNPEILDLLLRNKDFDKRSVDCVFGENPLHGAARANTCWAQESDFKRLEKLLSAGFDVNKQNNDGRTPLHELARGRVVSDYHYANPETHRESNGLDQFIRSVLLLIERGADLKIKDNKNAMPLDELRKEEQAVEAVASELRTYL